MIRYLVLMLLLLAPSLLAAQSKKEKAFAMQKNYKLLSENHLFLGKYEGTWTEEVNTSTDDSTTSSSITLTSVMVMVLGGRYLQITHTGTIENTPFEALDYITYNNTSQKFILTYMDSRSNESLLLEGTWTEPEHILTFYQDTNCLANKEILRIRKVFTFLDRDTVLVEYFEQKPNYPEEKKADYKYTRQ